MVFKDKYCYTIKHGNIVYELDSWGRRRNKMRITPEIKIKSEKYRLKNNIVVKCISDRILLYLRYVLDEHYVPIETNQERKVKSYKFAMTLYRHIRGDPEFTSRSPLTIAATIIYLTSIVFNWTRIFYLDCEKNVNSINNTENWSLKQIASILGITETAIQKESKHLKNYIMIHKLS